MNTHVLHTGAASDPLPGFKRVAACKLARNPSVVVMSMVLSNLMSKPKADRPSYQEHLSQTNGHVCLRITQVSDVPSISMWPFQTERMK